MRPVLAAALAGSIALLGAAPALATAQTSSAAAPAAEPAPLDGTWEGRIVFDKEAVLNESATPSAGAKFRIQIDDVVVRVFVEENGVFNEAKAGTFHIARVSSNAVIFSTQDGNDAWLESWCFVVTAKTKNLMIVEYSRLVNNYIVPHGQDGSEFATRGAGEFSRVTP
jgi:hypothetical protein